MIGYVRGNDIFRSSYIAQDDDILYLFDSVYRIYYCDRLVHFRIVNVCCWKNV